MRNIRVARRYATALIETAEAQGKIEEMARDLELVGKILHDSREFRLFVVSPVISAARKRAVFHTLLTSRVGKETLIFIYLLISKSREAILQDVIMQFQELRDEKAGIANAEVRTVVGLNYAQEKNLRAQLERITGKKVRLQYVIDKSLKGGLVVKIGDTMLDASVTHQLERLRERFVAG